MTSQKSSTQLSVIVPAYNEAENLPRLLEEINEASATLKSDLEVLVVDDGSTDDTPHVVRELQSTYPYLRCIRFGRNCRKSAALAAGFRAARGDVFVIMDADCQNPPEEIPRFLEAIADCDVVCGYRVRRVDHWHRKPQSKIANVFRDWMVHDNVRDSGCGYQAFRRECALSLQLFGGMHRFLPCLAQLNGYRLKEIPVKHRGRYRGVSKYNMWRRAVRAFVDLLAVRWLISRHVSYTIEKED